jgi:hypothetical protein
MCICTEIISDNEKANEKQKKFNYYQNWLIKALAKKVLKTDFYELIFSSIFLTSHLYNVSTKITLILVPTI